MTTALESITESFNLIDGKMVLCPKNKGKWITSNMLCYCDYDNSVDIERANVDYIIEKYASNRYHVVSGSWSYTQLYLKRTAINADTICAMDEYSVIDSDYYYEWQEKHSKEYFHESSISDYPVIEKALNRLHEDTYWTVSQNILQTITHFSMLWHGGESYHWSGSSYYFALQDSSYATPEKIDEVVLYLIDNPPYSKADLQPTTIERAADDILPGTYTVVVSNYNKIDLFGGGIDYMTTHEYPMQEITIEVGDNIHSIIQDAYDEIVEYNYEFLDYSPI